jgi:hypothetical protein
MSEDKENVSGQPAERPVESGGELRMYFESEPGSEAKIGSNAGLFTVRRNLVQYQGFKAAAGEILRVHRRGVLAKVSDSLQIVGQTGSGKTSLATWYEEQFPRTELNGQMRIRVLRLDTPECPTVKSLAEAILVALGDPWAHKGTAQEKTERIKHLCEKCGVELIIIDEIQHFIEGNRHAELMRVTDWLKTLINQLCVPFVLMGLPRSIPVTRSNPQLRRRFAAPYYLEPFSYATSAQQKEFRGVLKAIGQGLPKGSVNISSAQEAIRFFYASCGLIDFVVKLLDDAVSRGGSGPEGSVMREDFAASFVRVIWRDAPERLNPFHPKAQLRPLTRLDEPFDMLDDVGKYLRRTVAAKGRKP